MFKPLRLLGTSPGRGGKTGGYIYLLVFKMTHAGHYHSEFVLYAVFNTVFISYRAAGVE